jgi:hypothetical protein
VGQTVALVRDWGDVLANPRLGLYGAIIVGPAGATYSDPLTGADMAGQAGWRVDVHPPGAASYRDFTLFFQDEDAVIGTHIMPYSEHVSGVVGLNYNRQTLAGNPGGLPGGIPVGSLTPMLEAFSGDPFQIHVLAPYSEQAHVFTLEGHRWPQEPRPGANLLSAVHLGALEAISIVPLDGAGPPADYLYGDHRAPYREAGLWGIFRVHPPGAINVHLRPLPDR